ncbi:hypothetical protein AC626_24935 [Pseudoalteromonas rubra]|uniref:Carbamoyl-phosphate synthase (glutamine-hydrolyzing) n=1 Tax=Pseudoalteromonas rubra TaxID=43658 RepID=A0A0L0EL21_9GAMM|nr:hypothetical protein AC626_24935 [Pseudoalteromonas rubra]
MNTQFAVKDGQVYLIEVNPRAARTVPFVSKATGVALAKVAARCMVGQSLESQGVTKEVIPPYYSVKEVVLPFAKFQGVDPMRGPEMRSTGEVMGVGENFAEAFAKAQLGASNALPRGGRALLSVRNGDKARVVELAKTMKAIGFELDATKGTAQALEDAGIEVRRVNKVFEGRPHILDRIRMVSTATLLIPQKAVRLSKIRRCYVVVHFSIRLTTPLRSMQRLQTVQLMRLMTEVL